MNNGNNSMNKTKYFWPAKFWNFLHHYDFFINFSTHCIFNKSLDFNLLYTLFSDNRTLVCYVHIVTSPASKCAQVPGPITLCQQNWLKVRRTRMWLYYTALTIYSHFELGFLIICWSYELKKHAVALKLFWCAYQISQNIHKTNKKI